MIATNNHDLPLTGVKHLSPAQESVAKKSSVVLCVTQRLHKEIPFSDRLLSGLGSFCRLEPWAYARRCLLSPLRGGIALAIYDRPRATVDIDLLIAADSLAAVVEVAKALEYTVRGLDMTFANDAIEIRRVSKIDQETGFVLSLDMLLVTPQIQQIWDSRVQASWEGGKLSVVSREGLIALKKLSGRPQDLADISALMEEADDARN